MSPDFITMKSPGTELLFVTELNTIETTELGFLERKTSMWPTLWPSRCTTDDSLYSLLSYTFRLSAQLCWVHGHPLEKGSAWPLLSLLSRKCEAQTKAQGMQHGSLPIEVGAIPHTFQRNKSTPIGTHWFLQGAMLLVIHFWTCPGVRSHL